MPEENAQNINKLETRDPERKNEVGQNTYPDRPQLTFWSASGLLPGLILILIGILFMFNHYGMLRGEWWQYFLVGLGVIFLIEAWIQYINPSKGLPRVGRVVAGLILIAVGLIFLFDPTQWWPLILIVIGIILIVQFIIRRRAVK